MLTRFGRIATDTGPRWVEIAGDEVLLLGGPPWEDATAPGVKRKLAGVRLLAPTPASKVVCVGRNYSLHAKEMGGDVPEEPRLFLKPSTALNDPGAPIVLPPASNEVHHEAELGLVIGKRLHDATEKEAQAGIFALTCFNDVTARDIQRREVQHTRAKSYDTFACAGPWMVVGADPSNLRVTCRVNGQVKQDGTTADMVWKPAALVAFMSQVMTLLPGDLIATGTPEGVGPIADGDEVEVEIESIGVLKNPVARR